MFAFLAVEVYEPLDRLLFPSLPLDLSGVGLLVDPGADVHVEPWSLFPSCGRHCDP